MAMNESQSEPSMEEILASIRRIIAEDDTPPPASDDVLELQEPVDAPPSASTPGAAANIGADDLVFEDAFEGEAEEYVAPAPVDRRELLRPASMGDLPLSSGREEALLSEAVASATAAALTRLAGSMRVADDPNQTIEGLVRDLLKPLLKDWLDRHLPDIVEAKVEAALERVARLAR